MNPGRREGPLAATAAGVLLALTLSGCAAGPTATPDAGAASSAPVPASTASANTAVTPPPSPSPEAAPAAEQLPSVMAASAPATLTIPSISVRTDLIHLGLEENGSLKVPQDDGNGAPASWYDGSPTPGERGPSVLLGHVNSPNGRGGIFADLRKLTPGAEIIVSRADGSTAVFIVDRGALYPKDGFPTFEVYGNTPGSELRLITCDGYDSATGEFDDNYVIYATLKA